MDCFYKNDMEAVIDFGQPADFSKVTLTTNVEKGDWIFDARPSVSLFQKTVRISSK